MKYTKNTLWLIPFITEVANLIPYKKITNIRGYKVKAGLSEQTDGSTLNWNNKYSINLLLLTYCTQRKQHRPKPMHFILDTLAHELAHTVHWEHSPEHYALQAKIMLKFAKVLKKLNINDSSKRSI